ncbi:MAG: MXAN_6640 family putative metalloprotease [Nocardioides sp.]
MRRTLATTLVALSLAASTLAATPSSADDKLIITPRPAAPAAPTAAAVPTPARALSQAEAALEGDLSGARRPEATLALRDLFVSLPQLRGDDRAQARHILARPTDGAGDQYGDGYTVASKKKCGKQVCIHWVPTTSDAPPGKKWVNRSLRTMQAVWRTEVGKLGYRRPVKDGRRGGGDGKFDVYLKDVGSQGLYGYCAPEFTKRGYRRLASGYCVLDNDFARSQFGTKAINSLEVTAAHEFFHAVQFAYDYREDPWLLEATATWMEERFADMVNDNRQYLPDSQLAITYRALDTFDQNSSVQYGNWVFFEYLSERFGLGVVKRIWEEAGHFKGDGQTYSVDAVKRVMPRKAPFEKVYAQFAAANTTPGRSYPEGKAWPSPAWVGTGRLGKDDVARRTFNIAHLATNDFRLTPKKELKRKSYKLEVKVDGPLERTSPMAAVVWHKKSGKIKRLLVKLNRQGDGALKVPFNRQQTKRIYVVAVNASTRFNCGASDFTYSCKGTPRDDGVTFKLTFKVVNSRR